MSAADIQRSLQQAFALHQAGKLDKAGHLYRQILRSDPENCQALHYLGVLEAGVGNVARAKSLIARSLQIEPQNVQFIENYATTLCQAADFQAALQASERGLELNQANASLLYVRAVALHGLNRLQESIVQFDRLLALQPNHVPALNERGSVLAEMRQYEAALASVGRAIALQPRYAEAHLNAGNLYSILRRHGEALAAYDKALALRSDLADAWLGRGIAFAELGQHGSALAALDGALKLRPDLARAWAVRGNVLLDLKRYAEAYAAYDRASKIEPQLRELAGRRLFAKMHLCDWNGIESDISDLLGSLRSGQVASPPFSLLSISSSATDQLQCAQGYVAALPAAPPLLPQTYSHDRIRVAYLSGDFRDHPIGYLIAGLLEKHDKSRFEVAAISYGGEGSASRTRRRIKDACERFIDVEQQSDGQVAELIRALEIDIAVDLSGITAGNRPGILLRRPAPIQVNYLGYLGTMGAEFIDYVIADKIAVPFDRQPFFTEKIVHLPDSFLVTDDRQEIAEWTPTREEVGLPPQGFVFCSFNNSYKFARPVFATWMRLLLAVPGSVLWLAKSNAEMVVNLQREARRLGVDPQRIVFAPNLALPQHLARQRLAGLFLDTAPYNAGATAAGSLWSGVPVLTVLGDTFVGRMAASQLHAVGLPELVTRSLEEYERLAVKLASDPGSLSSIRGKLQENIRRMPLFDTDRFRRHLEQAYLTMVEIRQREDGPRQFAVPSS